MIINSISLWIFVISIVYSIVPNDYNIVGTIDNEWLFVRDLFENNFVEENDLGASISIYYQGKSVVDLWGGWFDRSRTKPYDNNTLQLVFSTTKGLVAIAAALCVQKGLFSYSDLVIKYWPEYGQNGKENTTIADILSHRAGLPFDSSSPEQFVNWTEMIHSLEQRQPSWSPGTTHGYHAFTYGWLAGEIIRRADPKKRTLQQFIQDEISNKLNAEFYVGLPIEESYRVSPLVLNANSSRMTNETMKAFFFLFNEPRIQRAEIPAANGITNAQSLAKIYASLISDLDNGKQKRILDETILKKAIQSNTPIDEPDFTSLMSSIFAMGFMLLEDAFPYFKSTIFGHPGAGGSIGFAIPEKNLSFAYVMNQLDIVAIDNPYYRIQTILRKVAEKINDHN